MRFNEFKITEATLQSSSTSSWPGYIKNLIDAENIGLGPQGERASGLELTANSKSILRDLLGQIDSADGKVSRDFAKTIENTELSFTDGTVAPIKFIHKSKEIKGGKNSSGKEKKPWNEGEVSETILGAALYARFISKNNINQDDVLSALKDFTKNPVPGGFRISDSKRNGENPIDMIALNKALNNNIISEFVNNRAELKTQFPEGVKSLENKLAAAADYVNKSTKVIKALEESDASPELPIIIKTDGVGDQKGTKADLQIEIGQWKQLLSLKVNDIKQFGQESGSSGLVVSSFFQRFIPNLNLSDLYMVNGEPLPWTPQTGQGWPDTKDKRSATQLKKNGLWEAALEQIYKLTGQAYQRAAELLENTLATDEGSSEIIKNLYNGIIHHVQGDAQFQTVVILNPDSKTAWKELEFGVELEQALSHYKFEVEVEIGRRGGNNHKLRIYGTPVTPEAQVAAQTKIKTDADAKKAKKKADSGQFSKNTGREMLIQLRSYQQDSGNMRNAVEMGPLLKNLTEVQKIEDVANDEPDQQISDSPSSQIPPSNIVPPENPAIASKELLHPEAETNTVSDEEEVERIKKLAGIKNAGSPK
jgi:hypothetical protein